MTKSIPAMTVIDELKITKEDKPSMTYPGASKYVPFIDLEVLSNLLSILYKIPGCVLFQAGRSNTH